MTITSARVVGQLTSHSGYDMRHRTESDRVRKSSAKLAHRSCSTYANGACLINDGPCNYETDAPLACTRCPFFERSILPSDSSLERQYQNVLSGVDVESGKATTYNKTCKECGGRFESTSKNRVYCDGCKNKRRKRQTHKAVQKTRK